jgi:hypothetical protein
LHSLSPARRAARAFQSRGDFFESAPALGWREPQLLDKQGQIYARRARSLKAASPRRMEQTRLG